MSPNYGITPRYPDCFLNLTSMLLLGPRCKWNIEFLIMKARGKAMEALTALCSFSNWSVGFNASLRRESIISCVCI